MDHERYPYYFSEPGSEKENAERFEKAVADFGRSIWTAMSRVAAAVTGEAKPAR